MKNILTFELFEAAAPDAKKAKLAADLDKFLTKIIYAATEEETETPPTEKGLAAYGENSWYGELAKIETRMWHEDKKEEVVDVAKQYLLTAKQFATFQKFLDKLFAAYPETKEMEKFKDIGKFLGMEEFKD